MKTIYILFLLFISFQVLPAQDTFSIVAMDPETGEVGSAGASCVNLFQTSLDSDDFLGELFPGVGAINTQAYYLYANQLRARSQMNAGVEPLDIIDYLIENDAQNNSTRRQYGIVGRVEDSIQSAAHTGENCDAYANHITGPTYAIQGNILLGQEILDSMEAQFLRAEGSLKHKLMAALQGANVVGADTRCEPNGTSSLFAFVKVAQSDDTFGDPSFVLSVRTRSNDEIEPIDSLQILFDQYIQAEEICPQSYELGPITPGFKTKSCLRQINYEGQVMDSQAFIVEDLIQLRKYAFSFCEGYSEDIFEARVVISEYDSEDGSIGELLSDGLGCTHNVKLSTRSEFNDILIVITNANDCQATSQNLENGQPTFKCAVGR